MGKICGAVQRIDDPATVRSARIHTAFLSQNAVGGKSGANRLDNGLFRFPVRFRDQIDHPFFLDVHVPAESGAEYIAALAAAAIPTRFTFSRSIRGVY